MKFDVKNWLLESEIQRGLRHTGLWHVVYHEGIRGHHILFEKETIKAAEAKDQLTVNLQSSSDDLVSAVVSVLKQPTLSELKSSLHAHDSKVKLDLFRLYKRALLRYRDSQALSMN